MLNEKAAYNNLTNIDIDEQQRIWDERGKGYYGEYLVFCDLYRNITGNCKLLMNLNIPSEQNGTTEVDLLMIHETGIYVFEIKHYKGTIYGNDTDEKWTQYFRTEPNHSFQNPMNQNGYHIRALMKLLPEKFFYSVVVFTSEDCSLRTYNGNPNTLVCKLSHLSQALGSRIQEQPARYSMNEIDSIFNSLIQFSPMKHSYSVDGRIAPFDEWIQPIISSFRSKSIELNIQKDQYQRKCDEIAKNENERRKQFEKASKGLKRKTAWAIVFCILISISAIFTLTVMITEDIDNRKKAEISRIERDCQSIELDCQQKVEAAESKLAEMQKNFEHVDEEGNIYIKALNSFVKVSDVKLSQNISEAVSFTAKASLLVDNYAVKFTQDAKYIVMTTSGKVYEYNVFDEKYDHFTETLHPQGYHNINFEKIDFYGITQPSDIRYIKITGIVLSKSDDMTMYGTIYKFLSENLELELYSN